MPKIPNALKRAMARSRQGERRFWPGSGSRLTIAEAEAILKKHYLPAISDVLNKSSLLFKILQSDRVVNCQSKEFTVPLAHSTNLGKASSETSPARGATESTF